MRKREILRTVAVFGWGGVIMAIIMPLISIAVADLKNEGAYCSLLWLGGCIVSFLAGLFILTMKRSNMGEIGLLFILVGLISFIIHFAFPWS